MCVESATRNLTVCRAGRTDARLVRRYRPGRVLLCSESRQRVPLNRTRTSSPGFVPLGFSSGFLLSRSRSPSGGDRVRMHRSVTSSRVVPARVRPSVSPGCLAPSPQARSACSCRRPSPSRHRRDGSACLALRALSVVGLKPASRRSLGLLAVRRARNNFIHSFIRVARRSPLRGHWSGCVL